MIDEILLTSWSKKCMFILYILGGLNESIYR